MDNQKTTMKKTLICRLMLPVILVLVSCGTGRQATEETQQPVPQKPAAAVEQKQVKKPVAAEAKDEKKQRIRAVLISPTTPRAESRITVNADISPSVDTEGGESLSYVFYKNTEIFKEQEDNSLPPGSAVKGDSLFADVILYSAGIEIDKKRSSIIFVLNSKPEIGEVEFPEITGLGTYTITVNAADADEDELSFFLDEKFGVPGGMVMGEKTGLITYTITQIPEQDVKFKILVSDGDGGEDWKEMFIRFSRTTVDREKED